VTQIVAEEQD